MREHKTFAEFWPYYLQEHRLPSTRGWHYVGTILAILSLLAILVFQKWILLPIPMLCGYFFSWASHGCIERNKPATFTYPIWSILADFKMLFCFFTGSMGAELEFAGLGNAQQKNEEDIPESTNSNES